MDDTSRGRLARGSRWQSDLVGRCGGAGQAALRRKIEGDGEATVQQLTAMGRSNEAVRAAAAAGWSARGGGRWRRRRGEVAVKKQRNDGGEGVRVRKEAVEHFDEGRRVI